MSSGLDLEDAAIRQSDTFQKAVMKDVQPKFDTIVNVAFTYDEGGRWHNIDVTLNEYLRILQTGYVDNRQVCAIEVSLTDVDNEAGDKVKMIYDFRLLHTEKNPWRML